MCNYAPMEKIPSVLRTKEARFIDINIVALSGCNTLLNFAFGCLIGDIYLIIANGLGFISNVILISIRKWANAQQFKVRVFSEMENGGDGYSGDYIESKKI